MGLKRRRKGQDRSFGCVRGWRTFSGLNGRREIRSSIWSLDSKKFHHVSGAKGRPSRTPDRIRSGAWTMAARTARSRDAAIALSYLAMNIDNDDAYPLELDGRAMRALVAKAMEHIAKHVDSLGEQAVSAIDGGASLARSLAEPLPEHGTPFDDLLELLFERAVPCTYNTASPGYLAYIPGGGLLQSAIADLIANSVNRYVGVWLAAPGLVQLELNVIRWLCEMVGYPTSAGGLLTSGGSIANLTAVATARQERLGEQFAGGTIYTSTQAHHSVSKAAVLAGFPARNVRRVPVDHKFRILTGELERRLDEDTRKGKAPFLIVANAGTTNTGAVDDLETVAEIAKRRGLWLHVDAAYGGVFALTQRGQAVLGGLDRADSITLDPHKGLFLPYGTGSLLIRDVEALRRTHGVHADYMPAMQDDPDLVDFCELSPELSRDFRGLRAWLPIKMHGIGAFRRNLDEKMDLARWAAEQLRTIPDIEILAEPELSLIVFRLARKGLAQTELDRLNQSFLEEVNRRQRVFLTGTILPPGSTASGFALRICVLSYRTHLDRMEMAIEDIRQAVALMQTQTATTESHVEGGDDPPA